MNEFSNRTLVQFGSRVQVTCDKNGKKILLAQQRLRQRGIEMYRKHDGAWSVRRVSRDKIV